MPRPCPEHTGGGRIAFWLGSLWDYVRNVWAPANGKEFGDGVVKGEAPL